VVHSALVRINEELLERKVAAPTFSRQSLLRWRSGCQPHALTVLYPPGNIADTHFCYSLSKPQRHIVAAATIKSIEKPTDLIGNRTRDLETDSIAAQ
jgi:hypothetical protein